MIPDDLNRKVDANLIAAAPELLAALKDILYGVGLLNDANWESLSKEVAAAQAAIAKAEMK